MKYDNTPNKIRLLWFRTRSNTYLIERLETLNTKLVTVNDFQKVTKIETDWTLNNSTSYNLSLDSFPERLIPFIKIIPVVKTLTAWENGSDYIDDYTFSYGIKQRAVGVDDYNNYSIDISLNVTVNDSRPIYLKIVILIPNERLYNEIQGNTK